MQQIQLLTREDVVEIIEREVRERLQPFRTEVLTAVREAVAEIVAAELPPVLEKALEVELSRLREEVVATLRDALHSVMGREEPAAEAEDVEDYSV
jgi:SNF2 family DNA or RNA helicase